MVEIPNVPDNWIGASEALRMGVEDSVSGDARIGDNAAENIVDRLSDYGFRIVPLLDPEATDGS